MKNPATISGIGTRGISLVSQQKKKQDILNQYMRKKMFIL